MTLRTCGRSAHRFLAIAVVALAACFSPAKSLGQNRIWADFTTSMGNFTCVLDYTNAPKAVANFIGLTTGQKSWLDSKEGRVRTDRFYHGITFHRVIPNFMIQTGSRDGSGSDGPGYAFLDEFAGSASFNAFGMLAMANSGTNSNGAQFFVTVAPTTWLNGKHTIFGRVTAGSNVVYAISRVATSSDKPITKRRGPGLQHPRAGIARGHQPERENQRHTRGRFDYVFEPDGHRHAPVFFNESDTLE